jgi:hypothetical protein
VLTFHHRNAREKETGISRMVSTGMSVQAIKREISKCDVMCANCHMDWHHKHGV